MTEAELRAAWTRYMHRNDLEADLDRTWLLALQRCSERLLFNVQQSDIVEGAGRMMLHAGLIYLHELAQDDDGLSRELRMFDDAAKDFTFWFSRQQNATVDPFTYGEADNGP